MTRKFRRHYLTAAWLWLALGAAGCDAAAVDTPDAAAGDASADALPAFDPNQDPYAGVASGVAPRFEPEATDWHALPFPIDTRYKPDGTLDLSGFPTPREGSASPLLESYLQEGERVLTGFSVQPTIYVQMQGEMSAPPSVLETTAQNSRVLLVDVSPQSPEYGRQIPLEVEVSGKERGQYLAANLIMAHPVWGRPLRPLTTYAFVVRRSWQDTTGKPLAQPEAWTRVLAQLRGTGQGANPAEIKLAEALAPLKAAVDAAVVRVPWADMAAASVFTTGDPTDELRDMTAWVKFQAPAAAATDWKLIKDTTDYKLVEAQILAPDFQIGSCPYDDYPNGGFAFDSQGNPVVQKTLPLRVAFAIPKKRSLEVGGKAPVVLSTHGTGGNYLSFTKGGPQVIAKQLTPFGLPIVSIDQPLHGPRCQPEISGINLDLKSFNFLNIASGRSTFRQGALDQAFVVRLLREGLLNVPAEWTPDGKPLQFDPIRVVYTGHSQGGLTGALQAGVDDQIRSYVLSGAGAGLSLTLLLRKDPTDLGNLLTGMLSLDPGELRPAHPAVSVVQMLADATDPLGYGLHVYDRQDDSRPPDILLTEGLLDAQTPSDTAEALAAAMGLDLLAPAVHQNDAMQLAKTKVLSSPVKNNRTVGQWPLTAVLAQFGKDDHFAIFDNPIAAKLYQGFLLGSVQVGEALADTRP